MRFWFKRNQNTNNIPAISALKDVADPVILQGHDLAKWNYLGFTRCTYVDQNGNLKSGHTIFLFVSKNDEKRRSYYLASEYVEKDHPYVNNHVKPWAVGEGEIYHLIKGEGNYPSDYLKEYMLERFKCEWDTDTNWWATSDDAKYTSAQNKQKRECKEKPKTETKPETNIVTVDFGKQS